MEIVKKKLSDLKPLEKNVRKHGDLQLGHFVEALKQFGQTRAFVIDEDGNVLVGNGMHAAMSRMEWKQPVDCHVVRGLSEKDKRKLILSDNKLFQLGSDDFDVINEMLQSIADEGDFNVAGYSSEVLEDMMKGAAETLEDMTTYGMLTEEEKTQKAKTTPKEESEAEEVYGLPPQELEPVYSCPCCGEKLQFEGGDLIVAED
jgi:transcriptional regulator with PAS, ATPase and Fis domain